MQKDALELNIANFDRVAIIGCPGSGKTTLSRALGQIMRVTPVHLDKELWLPNWTEMPFEERQTVHRAMISKSHWLIDGMWRSHVEERICRATLVVWLDFETDLCLSRVLLRKKLSGNAQRSDIADGCLDNEDGSSGEEFIRYVKGFKSEVCPQIENILHAHDQIDYVHLTTTEQVDGFLSEAKSIFASN